MRKQIKILAILIMTIATCSATQAGLILDEGESFTWSFEPQDFSNTEELAPENSLYAQCYAGIANMMSNDLFIISYYENNSLEIPFRETTVTSSGSPAENFVEIELTSNPNLAWADTQGVIVFEAVSGDMEISNYTATTIVDGIFYTAFIPEPSSITLLFTGVGIFYLRKRNFSNQKFELTVKTSDIHAGVMHTETHF